MTDVSLSYVFAHPEALGLSLSHPVYLLLAASAFWIVRRGDGRAARLAAMLRVAAVTCLSLGLAGLALTTSMPVDHMTVIAAVDASESIDESGRSWSLRFINELAGGLAPGDELGVVTFGGDTRIARPPGPPQPLDRLPLPTLRTATDVGRGLDAALALLTPDNAHRIVLLSDGIETRGHARAKLALARQTKTAIYTALPPRESAVDVGLEKLAVPPVVADGTVFPLRIVARNSPGTRPARLTLSLDDEALGTEDITLQPGLNALEIPYRLSGGGSHRLRASIDARGDTLPGNNYRDVTVMVAGPPRVLLLTSQPHSPLADALGRKDVEVDVKPPQQAPTDAEALLEYHCVVAEDIFSKDVPGAAWGAVERYVRDFGGGFVLAGGQRTYGDPGFKDSALERLLPVTLEPRRLPPAERDPLALMVVIDRSNSMGYSTEIPPGSTLPQRDPATSKLHYAKAAALAVIGQLKDRDYAGLIVFDSQPLPIAPLRPLSENRARLEELIPLLVENGGTDFYDALDWARAQLVGSGIGSRHIILLTDGDTNRNPADHYPLIDTIAKAGITVTTIRIGDDVVNLALLNDISKRTGGRFYHVANGAALPELMVKDTATAMNERSRTDEDANPRAGAASQVLRGIKPTFPALHGYAFAKTRAAADVPVYVPTHGVRDPILASWQYGLGRVAAFTADPATDAETWVAWDNYGKFWSQVVRWVMREQTPWDYVVEAHRTDGRLKLEVRAFDRGEDGVLFARVHLDDGSTQDVTLIPTAPRQFEAELPPLAGGTYPMTILQRRGTREVSERTVAVPVPSQEEEPQEEYQTTRPNTVLLEELAEATGGKFNPTVRDLIAREVGSRRLRYDLDMALIPLAMLCFLGDVAIRRLWLVHP